MQCVSSIPGSSGTRTQPYEREVAIPDLCRNVVVSARSFEAEEKRMRADFAFRLNTRLADAHPGVVVLSDGEVQADTLVWTAGRRQTRY